MNHMDNLQFNPNLYAQENSALLFVSDFNDSVSLENLWGFFSEFADKIVQIVLNKNKKLLDIYQQRSNNATVYFRDQIAAREAIVRLNLKKLGGRTVRVMWHDSNHSNRYNSNGNLFIKNVPEDVSPREFYEFFNQFGEIVSAKLNEDDDGKHYGYGYVHYADEESAIKATEFADGKVIWQGGALEVRNFMKKNERVYEANRNLYVKNFPPEFTESEINKLFSVYGPISYSKVLTDNATKKNFALVSFENEDSVNKALANANGKKLGEYSLYVTPLMKKTDRQRILTNKHAEKSFQLNSNYKNCNLHIRNIPFSVKEDELYNNFVKFGEIKSVKIAKMILVTKEKNETKELETSKGFGYVCFTNPESARLAIETLNNGFLSKHETWKRPLLIEYFMPRRERTQVLKQQQNLNVSGSFGQLGQIHNTQPQMIGFNSQTGYPQQQQGLQQPYSIYSQTQGGSNFMNQGLQQQNQLSGNPYAQQLNQFNQPHGGFNQQQGGFNQQQGGFNQQQMGFNQPQQIGFNQQQGGFNQQQGGYNNMPGFNQSFPKNQYMQNQGNFHGQKQHYHGHSKGKQHYNKQNNFNNNFNNNPQMFQYDQGNQMNPMMNQFNQMNVNQFNEMNKFPPQQKIPQGMNNMNQVMPTEQPPQNMNYEQIFNNKQSDEDIDLNYLYSIDDEGSRKDYLGECIFKKIEKHPLTEKKGMTVEKIGKITGMILGIDDIKEITETCRNVDLLTSRINEALALMDGNN